MKRKQRPPAEGERVALSGFVPQYLVAAEKVLEQLNAGMLEAVIIGDPQAGRLDDFQLIRKREGSLRLDAYQVKWGDPARVLSDSEFRGLLADAVKGLGKIRAAQQVRRADQAPIERFVAHIYSNRAPSQAGIQGEFSGRGLSVAAFLDELWPVAAARRFASVEDIPERWRSYLEALARRCGEEPARLLSLAPEVRFELRQQLPADKIPTDSAGMRFRSDVAEMASAMKRLVIEGAGAVTLDTEEFLAALNWSERGSQRSIHQFPLPSNLKQIRGSIERLQDALDRHRQGYVFLFGSPGSGKSTLLTHALRLDPRIEARYYAFVPDHDSRTRGEAAAFLHDLLLALRGSGTLLPPESDITLLREELRRALVELGHRAREEGRPALILIDGLDHVLRHPKPRDALLNELPAPEQVPEGVVIILGTRRREDLPATVAAVARGERVIETEPLSRAAVLELASEAGVGESGERIFDLSEGHPLLTQTFIGLVEPLAKNVRGDILDSIEPLQGEIWPYYERIWAELVEDDDLLDALGVISRQRVPIDLLWLEETGTPRAAIRRLEKLHHLFRELSSGRWVFFHDSFREFLRRRTAERGGKADHRRDQQIHVELAERCLASEPNRPEAWESIHHLVAAGRPEEALVHATPSFYRAQYEALRPVPDVKAAIREAAAALHDCHRSDAVLNLALSAADAQGREYSYPEGGEFAQVLVGLGEPDLAMAHVEHVDDHVVDRDRVRSAMGLVIALLDHGYQADAERFFDLHEPLQWLGGGGERHGASRGPWEALRAWARAAVLVRGAGHVIAGVRLLCIDEEDIPWRGEDFEEQLRGFRVDLLAAAAIQALRWERGQDYAELLAAIDPDEPGAPDEIAECLLSELAWAGDEAEGGEVAERLDATLSEQLSPALRLRVARALFRFDRGAEAARQIETVPEPELPERSSGREGDHEWAYLYSYYRLRAALGHRDSPTEAVPSPAEGRDTEVLVARHLIRQAELHGRLVAGEDLTPDELVRVVRSFHAFRDGLRKENRFGDYGIGELRTTLAHTAIAIAGEIGPVAVERLWGYWEERWRDHEPEFLGQGIKLLSSFREAGLSETIIRSQLANLEEAFESRTDFEADDLVSLARAWLEFEESERARKCLAAAISHTGGVGFRKDHQLIEWVRLIEPLLVGPDAAPAARWLTEALISLNERVEATAPWEAARLMLRILASADPALAIACGETLSEARILDLDEVILKVLEGTATRATQLWWAMVAEVLVAVGSAPPREALALAVSASDDPEVAAGNLRTVCERVAIEGRPIQRLPWRGEILDAATDLGLSSEDLGLSAKDLILGDETPSQSSYSDDSKDDRVDLTVVELIAELKDDPSDHSSLRAILRRAEELTSEQVTELDSLLTGTDEESRFAVGLAKRAVAAGNTAEAWDQAERCLSRSASGDWQRHWAGGPVLDAVPIMLAIDAERGRRLAFERFATLASQDRYLLSEVGRSFEDYLQVLGPFDPLELSGAIWSYLTHLLARDAPTTAPAIARPLGGQSPELGQAQIDEALSRVIVLLLSSPYTLARRSGQRALSAAFHLDGAGELLASLVEDPTVDPACFLPSSRPASRREGPSRRGRWWWPARWQWQGASTCEPPPAVSSGGSARTRLRPKRVRCRAPTSLRFRRPSTGKVEGTSWSAPATSRRWSPTIAPS